MGGLTWIADVRVPAGVWVLTRCLFVLLTYFGVILFRSTLHGAHPSFLHQLLPAWQNPASHGGWDTQWYIDIAQRGYTWKKAVGTSPTAFFPLYPLCIRVLAAISQRSYLVCALAVSNAAFLVALTYLYRLTRWEIGREAANRAVLYIAVFPTALFFFAGYSESLFLLCTAGCFYYLRRERWVLAGLLAGLASATRVTGILLVLPLLYEYARAHNFSPRRVDAGVCSILLAPLGLLAFMAYLWQAVGDPLAFSHYQTAWQKVFTPFLWKGFLESLRQIAVVQPPASFMEAHNLINLTAAVLGIVLTAFAVRRLPASYTLYLVAFWILTLSSPAMAGGYPVPFISMSRYVLTLFPLFMVLAMLGRDHRLHDGYLLVSSAMLSLLTIQFVNGGWVI